MKLQENEIYFLRENCTGAEDTRCQFRFAYAEDALCFWFRVEDDEIVSPYTEDNEDIWQGDAVEVFLSPDGDRKRYLELEISPFGVRFYGKIVNEDGKTPVLTKQKPPFAANVRRTEFGYEVFASLPLAAPDGFDRGKMVMNAFCLDKRANGGQRLFALNPTLCGSFHRPEFFVGEKNNAPKAGGTGGGKGGN